MKLHTMPKNSRGQIKDEIMRALELLGADRALLAAVGSWGDILPDSEVLKSLKR
jgi:hypothetical protein